MFSLLQLVDLAMGGSSVDPEKLPPFA